MAQKKPAWHALYQKNDPPAEQQSIRVGGMPSEQEREALKLQLQQLLGGGKRPAKKRGKRRRAGRKYTIALTLLTVLLVAGLAGMSAVQTLRVLRQGQDLTTLSGQVTALGEQVDSLTQSNEDLTKKNQQLQGQQSGTEGVTATSGQSSFDYQSLYPELKVASAPSSFAAQQDKTVYLTFNDGPSSNTEQILDVLKAKGAHATFFVTAANIQGHEALLQRMVQEGHTVGLYTYTHLYDNLYGSVKAFLADVDKAYTTIYSTCGTYPTVFRFPGGSINRYNSTNYQPYIAEMLRRGFVYYDWNVTADPLAPTVTGSSTTATDTTGGNSVLANDNSTGSTETETASAPAASQLSSQIVNGVLGTKYPTVLLYDAPGKTTTAAALETAVTKLQAQGYSFAALTNTVQPVTFAYP